MTKLFSANKSTKLYQTISPPKRQQHLLAFVCFEKKFKVQNSQKIDIQAKKSFTRKKIPFAEKKSLTFFVFKNSLF